MINNYNGVKFYSAQDLSCGYYLNKAEPILQIFDSSKLYTDVNNVIELYNTKQFLDGGVYLNSWSEDITTQYKSTANNFERSIAVFFSSINATTIESIIGSIDTNYIDDFWTLIERYKVYKNIPNHIFSLLLDQTEIHLRPILENRGITNYYGQEITDYIINDFVNSAQLLIAQYFEANNNQYKKMYFPKELSAEDREKILLNYIRSDKANPNYLKLIAESRSVELPLIDKTRLEAKRRHAVLVESLFSKTRGVSYGARVFFSNTQEEPFIIENGAATNLPNTIMAISYSSKWIQNNQDYLTLLLNFKTLFGYVDSSFRSQFVSQPANISLFEGLLGAKGKEEYDIGIQYKMKHGLYAIQMVAYCHELCSLGIRIENIFQWFFETYMSEELNIDGFKFNTPSESTTYLEKCKLLASEIDSVLKQFKMYVEDGQIDRDLFEMSSAHIKFDCVPSLIENKYFYLESSDCAGMMQSLFSNQSGFAYTEKTKSQYRNLCSLIDSEVLSLEDFHDYQRPRIKWLIDNGCMQMDSIGHLALSPEKVYILNDLYNNQVGCYYHTKEYWPILTKMKQKGEICFASSLLSKPEQNYMNYALNKAVYSNGLDLRNKYIHGTHSLNPDEHKQDYIELLKIMVLIIMKIAEELCLNTILTNDTI